MTLPTLYKKTNTGALEQWTIHVLGPMLKTVYGQVGGVLQDTNDTIREGKNSGKKNATTPAQQAEKEAKAKWLKQKKRGYVESREAAEAGEVDDVIEGGVAPMLAPNNSYPKDRDLVKHIDFPAYAQPKLDGIRCVAIIDNGKATLWSRTRKPIRSVPHIVEALEARFQEEERLILDGELYSHEFRDRFEDLISILRKDEPDSEGLYKQAEYHCYDLIQWGPDSDVDVSTDMPFFKRSESLHWLLQGAKPPLFCVDTVKVTNLPALEAVYEACLDEGYEGAMARNALGKYAAGKRSTDVAKMKEFEEHEMTIVGVNDGRGKDAGTAATFSVMLPCLCCGKGNPAKIAKVRLKATYDKRRALFVNGAELTGKKVTVTMKRWTADGMPYIPIGKAVRDYE